MAVRLPFKGSQKVTKTFYKPIFTGGISGFFIKRSLNSSVRLHFFEHSGGRIDDKQDDIMLFPNVKNENLSAVGLSFSSLFSPLDTFILLVKCLFSPFDSHFVQCR